MLDLKYPMIQAGMVWVSGAKLAAASANAGILGVIGAGSMAPELLKEHIEKSEKSDPEGFCCKYPSLVPQGPRTNRNSPILGGPNVYHLSRKSKKFTAELKREGATVIHVVANPLCSKKPRRRS